MRSKKFGETSKSEIKKYWGMRWSDEKIAKQMGCTKVTIGNYRRIMNLPPNYTIIRKNVDTKEFIKYYKKGWRSNQLAEHFNVSLGSISYYVKKLNLREAKIYCCDCGKTIYHPRSDKIRCDDCASIKGLIFIIMTSTRGAFASLAKTNLEKAEKIQKEMIQKEGPEFAEWALDGIFNDVKNKKLGDIKNE